MSPSRSLIHALFSLSLLACGSASPSPGPMHTRAPSVGHEHAATKNVVIVMGMIHGDHRTSEAYSLDIVQRYLRALHPGYVLAEIPPGRLAPALREYRETGEVTEPRVSVFPEYVDALLPLQAEQGYEIVPCAGWTREMADARRALLEEWERTRPEETAEVEAASDAADARIAAEGSDDDPRFIHTDGYDAIVREGMEPYSRLFNDDLGPGGWENINRAHYTLVERALDAHRGEGKTFLIMFGAWHRYWFLQQLRQRDDVILRTPEELLDAS